MQRRDVLCDRGIMSGSEVSGTDIASHDGQHLLSTFCLLLILITLPMRVIAVFRCILD